ncbi:MAG: hypothetical protein AAF340_11815 [Pseudomonadota bacterium]
MTINIAVAIGLFVLVIVATGLATNFTGTTREAFGLSIIGMVCAIARNFAADPRPHRQLWLFYVVSLEGKELGGFLHKARVTAP